MKQKNRSAFTLIELLTVIAIIGILAAILIPVVQRVRDSARSAQSLSNIRESGNLIQVMILNNNGVLATRHGGPGNDGLALWPIQLEEQGLLDDRKVLYSPVGDHGLNDIYTHQGWAWRVGYGMFMIDGLSEEAGKIVNIVGQSDNHWVLDVDTVRDPSRLPLLADASRYDGVTFVRILHREAGGNGSIALPHNGRAHVYFLDGHIDAAGPEELGRLGLISGHGPNAEEIRFPQPRTDGR